MADETQEVAEEKQSQEIVSTQNHSSRLKIAGGLIIFAVAFLTLGAVMGAEFFDKRTEDLVEKPTVEIEDLPEEEAEIPENEEEIVGETTEGCGIEKYTNENYPDFSFEYDGCEWELEEYIGEIPFGLIPLGQESRNTDRFDQSIMLTNDKNETIAFNIENIFVFDASGAPICFPGDYEITHLSREEGDQKYGAGWYSIVGMPSSYFYDLVQTYDPNSQAVRFYDTDTEQIRDKYPTSDFCIGGITGVSIDNNFGASTPNIYGEEYDDIKMTSKFTAAYRGADMSSTEEFKDIVRTLAY